MESECLQGPTPILSSAALAAQCTDGFYAETACGSDQICEVNNGNASCVDRETEDTGDTNQPSSEPSTEPSTEPASEPSTEPSSEASSEPGSEPSSETEGDVDESDEKGAGGCQMVQTDPWFFSLILVALGLRRRRSL